MRNRVFLRALVVREAAALALLVVIVLLVAATSDGNGPWLAALALFGVFLVVGAARITFTDRRVALRTGRATPPWEGAHATWGVVVAPITGPRATAVARPCHRAHGRKGGGGVRGGPGGRVGGLGVLEPPVAPVLRARRHPPSRSRRAVPNSSVRSGRASARRPPARGRAVSC